MEEAKLTSLPVPLMGWLGLHQPVVQQYRQTPGRGNCIDATNPPLRCKLLEIKVSIGEYSIWRSSCLMENTPSTQHYMEQNTRIRRSSSRYTLCRCTACIANVPECFAGTQGTGSCNLRFVGCKSIIDCLKQSVVAVG